MSEFKDIAFERTAARARSLLGAVPSASGDRTHAESSENTARAPGAADIALIAARIDQHSKLGLAAATTIAAELVNRASAANATLQQNTTGAGLTQTEVLALESVLQVRGRPSLRVLANRLESLDKYPGSEFWQEFVAEYEERITGAAASTGAAIVTAFDTGNPPWLQGSAWLAAPNRVVTNRHVLISRDKVTRLVENTGNGDTMRLRPGHSITIDFAVDDRTPGRKIQRRVTNVLYVARELDPVDIAVLEIETNQDLEVLRLAPSTAAVPNNLFVVGHPAFMFGVPAEVQAVFGNPDGRKRVSFGKLLNAPERPGEITHDASTIGGFSGGPVIGISSGSVAALHYFGDPASGNLAITADAIRQHSAYGFIEVSG